MNVRASRLTEDSGGKLWYGPLASSSEEYAERARFLVETIHPLLLPLKGLKSPYILDVGCGRGELTEGLTHRGYRVIGVDIRTDYLFRQDVVRGTATSLPFRPDSFDGSLMLSFLEHVPLWMWASILKEISVVNRSGARVVVQVPNPHFPVELHSKIPFYGYAPKSLHESIYQVFYGKKPGFYPVTNSDVINAFEDSGMVLESLDSFTYPLQAIPTRVRRLATVVRRIPMGTLMVFNLPKPVGQDRS